MQTLEDISKFYHEHHLSNRESKAWVWLEELGFDALPLSCKTDLGFTDRALNAQLPSRQSNEGRGVRNHLMGLGVLKETGFEALSGLVIPLKDESGQVVNLFSYALGQRSSGITQRLNDSGMIVCGDQPQMLLTSCPMDFLVLVGLGFNDSYSVVCGLDNEQLENLCLTKEKVYSFGAIDGLEIESYCVDHSKPLLRRVQKGANRAEIETLLEQATLKTPKLKHTEPTVSLELPFRHDGTHYFTSIDSHHYRVTGLERNQGFHSLKITLKLWEQDQYFIDSLDLTIDKQRSRFVQRASEELMLSADILKRDLGKLLLLIEQLQEQRFAESKIEPKFALTDNQQREAVEYLKSPNLIERIQQDFVTCGVVGEELNRLVGYLACSSRILEKPLAVIVQSSSAAGKTTLMKSVLRLFPEEHQLGYSALTGQSLYYLGDTNIDQKILSIAEETGASRASYALKLLLSEGELSIATTGKDPETGATTTINYHVKGRVMLFLTTTELEIDEELQNRCLVLTVDERAEQTAAIHQAQRVARTMQGIVMQHEAKAIEERHHNIQRVLKPYKIVNPFINELSFSSVSTRTRRDHEKYLTLIESITLLHQYQRKIVKREVGDKLIEALVVEADDIKLANQIAKQIFRTSLDDLPAHTRKVLDKIKAHVAAQAAKHKETWQAQSFTRRTVREQTGLSLTTLKTHMNRLIESELIAPVTGDERSKYVYQLLVSPDEEPLLNILESRKAVGG